MMRISPAFFALLLLACGSQQEPDRALSVVPEPSEISLQWTISNSAGELSCPDAGATNVEVVATRGDREIVGSLKCLGGLGSVAMSGMSVPHHVEVWLVNGRGEILDRVDIGEVTIDEGRVYPLGQIDFSP